MPRRVDLEAKLLADQERLQAARAKLLAEERLTERRIQQERYRKQKVWEGQVGRIAWNAGFHEIFADDLGAIEKLFASLTPSDLFGGAPVESEETLGPLETANP